MSPSQKSLRDWNLRLLGCNCNVLNEPWSPRDVARLNTWKLSSHLNGGVNQAFLKAPTMARRPKFLFSP